MRCELVFRAGISGTPLLTGRSESLGRMSRKRFSDVVRCARKTTEAVAVNRTPPFYGTNYDALRPYNPSWIREEHWHQMVQVLGHTWWKAISSTNKSNRNIEYEGSISNYTSGSTSIVQHKHRMEKKEKRQVFVVELFRATHTNKMSDGAFGSGSRFNLVWANIKE